MGKKRILEMIDKWEADWKEEGRCKNCNVPDNLEEGLCGDCFLKALFSEIRNYFQGVPYG